EKWLCRLVQRSNQRMQREESNCSARSSTEEWRTSEAWQTIQRTFWVASHCCCGIGQGCMPMNCWKLRVANTASARRLRGLKPGTLDRECERSPPNSRIREPGITKEKEKL